MTIKFIVSTFLGLLITSSYASENALSKQKLLEQLVDKKNQLDVLGKKIIDQEALVRSMKQRLDEFEKLLKEAQRQKFLKENPHQEINQRDLDKALMDEVALFAKSFMDVHNKKEQLILRDSFFKELLNEEDTLLFRFYLTKFTYDSVYLNQSITKWESLSDAIMDLCHKLDTIKE